jgi:hypothetical protein
MARAKFLASILDVILILLSFLYIGESQQAFKVIIVSILYF